MLGFLVKNLTNGEVMVRYLSTLVNDHKKYKVKLEHYDMLIKTVGGGVVKTAGGLKARHGVAL